MRGKNFHHKSQKRRPQADPDQPVLLYGLHTVRAALDNPQRTKLRLLATPNALARLAESGPIAGVEPTEVHPKELDKLLGPDAVHQGVVLECQPLPRLDIGTLSDARLLVVLDQVTDPHNVGAILRTACAFGADAVLTTARYAPQETGVLAKSASGALDLIPMVEVGNLGDALTRLKRLGIWCVGLDSEADQPLRAAAIDKHVALVMGAEGKGLRQKTRDLCDEMLRLDMPGAIKSLNVSNAAAIALFALTQK